MNATPAQPRPPFLSELPLWRLLVMLDDAERLLGPDSDSAKSVAVEIQSRLRAERKGSKRGGAHD